MTFPLSRPFAATLLCLAATPSALAQDEKPEPIPFAGGELTITETPEYEKIVAFDGRELARDYQVFFDGIRPVAGIDVAFFSVGSGGNACAPAAVMVWKPEDGEVTANRTPGDCGAPSPAVTDNAVFFVPYLLPGQTADVSAWAPGEGFSVHGSMSYVPQPGTGWADFDPAALSWPMQMFENADFYAAAEAVLGDALLDVATGLGTSSGPEVGADGIVTARGCVPHACGVSDSFVAVDPAAKTVFFAQMGDGGARFWPDRASWPKAISDRVPDDF